MNRYTPFECALAAFTVAAILAFLLLYFLIWNISLKSLLRVSLLTGAVFAAIVWVYASIRELRLQLATLRAQVAALQKEPADK